MLERKFKHSKWFKGSPLTVRQFLELAAENPGFSLVNVMDKKRTVFLFGPIVYKTVIKNENGGSYALTEDEIEYFNKRREFWDAWHKDFSKENFNGEYDLSYIIKENNAKMNVEEYANAFHQVHIA